MTNPTTTPTSLAEALNAITAWIKNYTVLPDEHYAPTLALWAAHTWAAEAFYTTPRLILSSPVPGSGKTRLLELLEGICHQPSQTLNISTAALFRLIASHHDKAETPPTLLFDETDAVFGAHPSAQAEELRGILNAGYKQGGHVIRTSGENFTPQAFPVFAPVALAGLSGHMPRTITTRAIIIEMRKRAPGEKVAAYRERRARQEITPTRDFLQSWATTEKNKLRDAEPDMPQGVEDRPAEIWEPLISIADMAGKEWGEKARNACNHFVFSPQQKPVSLGVELLRDIRTVMGHDDKEGYETVRQIVGRELINLLRGVEESPWDTFSGGEGITARRLAQLLRDFQVSSVTFKGNDSRTKRGYVTYQTKEQVGLQDAWDRYLEAPTHPQISVTSVTDVTMQFKGGKSGHEKEPVTLSKCNQPPLPEPLSHNKSVTDTKSVTEKHALNSKVTQVTEVTDISDRGGRGSDQNRDPEPSTGIDLLKIEATILDSLDPDVGQSFRTVCSSVPKKLRDTTDLEPVMEALTQRGLVTFREGRYFKAA